MFCGLSTASEMFLIFTTNYTNMLVVFFLFGLSSDKPEVFLPKYSLTAILHAAHFRRVLSVETICQFVTDKIICDVESYCL